MADSIAISPVLSNVAETLRFCSKRQEGRTWLSREMMLKVEDVNKVLAPSIDFLLMCSMSANTSNTDLFLKVTAKDSNTICCMSDDVKHVFNKSPTKHIRGRCRDECLPA